MKVRRMIGAGAGVIFKGSGFYQTDYRSSSYKKQAEKDTKAKSDTSSQSKGKSECPAACKNCDKKS
jgi:hypothetical protein